MKIKGEFVLRQIMDSTVAIPVSATARRFNGMIVLNDVSKVIWTCLEKHTDLEHILRAVTDAFAVSDEEAKTDILEFLDKLRSAQLLED